MKAWIRSAVVVTTCALAAFAVMQGTQVSAAQKDHKVDICHGTASAKNPYVLIRVDQSAVRGHFDGTAPGHGKNNYPDFFAVNGSCAGGPPDSGAS